VLDALGREPESDGSPYAATVEHVREFVTFLRACGGFEIW
jgi:hypothetical protein